MAVRFSYILLLAACAPLLGIAVPHRAEARPPVVPQAMVDACNRHHEGDACQFELGGKSISGTCSPLPDAELACRPGPTKRPPKSAPRPQAE